MSRRRLKQHWQWTAAGLLAVLLTGGLGWMGWRLFGGGPRPTIPLPWAGLSDADRASVARAVSDFYAPLKDGAVTTAAGRITPPPAAATASAAARWLSEQLLAQQTAANRDFDACANQVQALGWAVEQWTADRDDAELPPNLEALVPAYFKTLPTCPDDHSPYHYEASRQTGQFTISCKGRHHLAAGGADNSPEYSSQYGLSRLHQPADELHPRVQTWNLASIEGAGLQVVAVVHEEVEFCGVAHSAESRVTLERVGDAWKVELPETPGATLLPDRGLAEDFLQALAVVPGQLQAASASADDLTTCSNHLRQLAAALEAFASDHQGNYPSHLTDLVPRYVRELPRCPVDGGSYADGYQSQGQDYTLACLGGRHAGCHIPDGYPRIDNMAGLLLSPAPATETSLLRGHEH